MRSFYVLSLGASGILATIYGCSQSSLTPPTGNPPAATAGSSGSSTGTAGAATGTAGAATGTAGAATGTAGAATGTAGSGAGGSPAAAGAAGASVVAGAGGTIGAGTAGGPAGGSPGAAGAADLTSVAKALDGYMWIGTCTSGSNNGLDCTLNDETTNSCPNPNAATFATRGLFRTVSLTMGGDPATKYTITLEVRGVAGTKCYTGGTPAAPDLAASPEVSNNGWYSGGTPTESLWNTYELHVSPPVTGATNLYYLNSFPNITGWCEKHETFPMNYTASFPVMGGGTVQLVLHDSNCLGQQNCGGPDSQPTCASARTVDLTGMPTPPSNFTQPYKESNGTWPQWLFLHVKSVTAN